ncbi:hypothetical protein PV328_000860 [Microctonus aethiopoides]|uniref:Elongation of very long chain fatty acids protein n=1 Tax=Microctonus aethiopoides TaxID=144406 RepID=A0AA39KWW1_9HYME|nr:hypothetical protein PV328_000860 [Microctonus aethiopoides]
MTSLMKLVVSNYNEILETNKDPHVDNWFLMHSPTPVLAILAAYLLFVLKLGPMMMVSRPAFKLNNTLIFYNAFQVLFSIWLVSLSTKVDFIGSVFSSNCGNDSEKHNGGIDQYVLSYAAWWYFFAKIIELLDTIFFVLRKKQSQVTFLHVYHHTITAFFSWCYLKLLPGEQGILIGFLNSIVHVVMYSYYLIAAMGPEYRKYLWWKKYMTWMQLIQFGLMLVYLMVILFMDCAMPKALTYFFVTNVIIFIYLFSDFYRKSYINKKKI